MPLFEYFVNYCLEYLPYQLWVILYYAPRPHTAETLSDDARLTSDLCRPVEYTSGLSRQRRGLGKSKIGTEVGHVSLGYRFQGQKVKGQLAGGVCFLCILWRPSAQLVTLALYTADWTDGG